MFFTRVLIVLFLFSSYFTFSQEDDVLPKAPILQMRKKEVSFAKVEEAPVYPGCEKYSSRQSKKKCFHKGISSHIAKHFNVDLSNSLGLDSGLKRIMVKFKIDQKGNTTNITAKGPHPKLEVEAIRIITKLPKIKPGKSGKMSVITKYALPISIYVEELPKEKNKK